MDLRLFFIHISFWQFYCIYGQFNMTEYKQMPPLYQFEDYDACFNYENISQTYCIVYAEIIPNKTSQLWQKIEKFSADHKRHFRHDHLFFGICLEYCKNSIENLSESEIQDSEILSYYANVHQNTDERKRHDHFVKSCLNYQFQRKYNLQLRTSIEYCEHSDKHLEHDVLDFIMYAILVCIAILITFSSIYDYCLKLKQPLDDQNINFYRTQLRSNIVQKLFTSFSLCRNYYRLTLPPNNQIAKDLRFFDAFRVIGVFLVILAHSMILFGAVQVDNTQFLEHFFYRIETAILENGSAIVQMFFVMSGFLLYVNFTKRNMVTPKSNLTHCIKVYFKVFIYRYLRLIPSLIAVMLFNATILVRLQNGPFWRHFAQSERTFCRKYWWKNLFFINNFSLKETCLIQTWYLAADVQLFLLFLLILIFIIKYPQLKKYIYSVLVILSVAIPAILTYTLKLEATFHSHLEHYRYLFYKNAETFYQSYIPFYNNLGGFLCGILSADLYMRLRKKNEFKCHLKYEISWCFTLPVFVVLLLTGAIFMVYDFEKPSIFMAIYAGLYRNLWSVITCIAVLGMCFKLGWIAYEFTCMSFFRLLASISYQSFLWHLVIVRLMTGHYRQPIYLNRLNVFLNIFGTFVITNLLAFLMALFIEYPFAEIVNCLRGASKSVTEKSCNKSNAV